MGDGIRNQDRQTVAAIISRHYAMLSPGHRRTADLILSRPHEAALMTLEDMSRETGISKATINRLGEKIGLDGYQELKRLLREELQGSLHPIESFVDTLRIRDASKHAPWSQSLTEDLERIGSIEPLGGESVFARAVDLLVKARRVYIAGFGSSAFFAEYAAFCLSSLRGGCQAVTDASGIEGAMRHILDAGPDDAALQLGFARYSRDGIHLAENLRERGVPLICITDKEGSPFVPLATYSIVMDKKSGFVLSGSGTAGVAVIEALLRGTAAALGADRVRDRYEQLSAALGNKIIQA